MMCVSDTALAAAVLTAEPEIRTPAAAGVRG